MISIDTKKKELIGNFKNPGTRYKRGSDLVNDHDFAQYAIGKAFPYGIFDEHRHEGFVYVGQSLWNREEKCFMSKETPEFAAEEVSRWWAEYGKKRHRANRVKVRPAEPAFGQERGDVARGRPRVRHGENLNKALFPADPTTESRSVTLPHACSSD